MVDSERTAILEKIAKLFALAEGRGATPAEAATAAAHAQRMLEKYKLSRAEVDELDAEEPVEGNSEMFSDTKVPRWVLILSDNVARANDCRIYIGGKWVKTGNPLRPLRSVGKRIVIVGRKSDSEIARYMFVYLHREIERLAQEALKSGLVSGRTGGSEFRIGAAMEVGARILAAKREERAQATTTAIVRVNQQEAEVESFMDKLDLKSTSMSCGRNDETARTHGRVAGSTIEVRPGVGGREARELKA